MGKKKVISKFCESEQMFIGLFYKEIMILEKKYDDMINHSPLMSAIRLETMWESLI